MLDATMGLPSVAACAEGWFLTAEHIRFYWDCYVPAVDDRARPEVSPLQASVLAGLPRALIVTAEHDPLRDEAEAFARRLDEEGVGSELLRVGGQIHGFLSAFAGSSEATATIEWLATGLRDALLHTPVA
jgi:acetyl esterase